MRSSLPDTVHENPKPRKGVRGLHDTVKHERQREQERDHRRGRRRIGKCGDAHLGEGRSVDEELDAEEEDEDLTLGGLDADDGVIEAGPDEEAGDDLVRDFDDDVGDHEGFPGVGFAGAFADFVEGALGYEEGLDLEWRC